MFLKIPAASTYLSKLTESAFGFVIKFAVAGNRFDSSTPVENKIAYEEH
jgi:hypothetical protein